MSCNINPMDHLLCFVEQQFPMVRIIGERCDATFNLAFTLPVRTYFFSSFIVIQALIVVKAASKKPGNGPP